MAGSSSMTSTCVTGHTVRRGHRPPEAVDRSSGRTACRSHGRSPRMRTGTTRVVRLVARLGAGRGPDGRGHHARGHPGGPGRRRRARPAECRGAAAAADRSLPRPPRPSASPSATGRRGRRRVGRGRRGARHGMSIPPALAGRRGQARPRRRRPVLLVARAEGATGAFHRSFRVLPQAAGDRTTTASFSAVGGVVTVRCRGGAAEVRSVAPYNGYRFEVEGGGHLRVRPTFTNGARGTSRRTAVARGDRCSSGGS